MTKEQLEAMVQELAKEREEQKAEIERLKAQAAAAQPKQRPRVKVNFTQAGNVTFYAYPSGKGKPPLSGTLALDDLKVLSQVEAAVRETWKAAANTVVPVPSSKQDSNGTWYKDDNDVVNVPVPAYRE